MGPQGPEGPEGPQGAPGPQGPEGPAGPEGASPFELVGLHAVYSQGNVGIGTSSPASRLHVAGDARFDGSVTIAPTTRTHMIPAAAFQSDGFSHIGGGSSPGVIRGSEARTVRAWAPVFLPDGAVVTAITAGVYDDDPVQDMKVNLRRALFTQGITTDIMGSAVSSGSSGYQTPSDTSIVNPVIDHSTWFYHIEIDFGNEKPTGGLTLYAVRITYTIDAPLP